MKVINVVGARPNFMKIAPIIREINRFNSFHLSPFTIMLDQTDHIEQMVEVLHNPSAPLFLGDVAPALWITSIFHLLSFIFHLNAPNALAVINDIDKIDQINQKDQIYWILLMGDPLLH